MYDSHLTFLFDRESAIGLVDYEDEDEEMPSALGINGKDSGRVLEKIPLTDPIWQEVEDGTIAKRKNSLAPSLEQTGATPPKRQKPEDSHAVDSDSQPGIFNASRVGSDVVSSEVRGLAESVMPASTPQAAHDVSKKASTAEESKATSPEQHEPNAVHQASSSEHGSWNKPEAAPNVDGEHPHQDLHSTPSGSGPVESLSGNVGSAATNAHDVPAESAPAKTACEVEKASDVVREECANGESPTKSLDVGCSARGSSKNGTDCCSSVEDCNGSASESSERVGLGAIPIDGSNNSNLSHQHNVSLGSEGNKLTNLGTDILRTVSPTSPGSYPVR